MRMFHVGRERGRHDERNGRIGIGERRIYENEIGRKAVNISKYVPLLLTILFRGGRRESEFRQVNFLFVQIADLSISSLFNLFSRWSRSRELENGMVEQDDFAVAKFYLQSRVSFSISQARAGETWARCEGV